MRRIVAWCLANRPVVILFALLFMGAGIFSIFRLNQELLAASAVGLTSLCGRSPKPPTVIGKPVNDNWASGKWAIQRPVKIGLTSRAALAVFQLSSAIWRGYIHGDFWLPADSLRQATNACHR